MGSVLGSYRQADVRPLQYIHALAVQNLRFLKPAQLPTAVALGSRIIFVL